jgi:hypothetical protein
MNDQALCLTLGEPDQAREAVRAQFLPFIGKLIDAGKRVDITACEEEDAKSVQQRRFYHRYVLVEIAEQAKVNGEKFDMKVWKDFFREKYVGYRWVVMKNPLTSKKLRRKVRISTEDLGVKAYSKLIDQVCAFGATELGVTFSVPNWQSYQ